VPLERVSERAGGPEDEMVGVYLLTKGDLLGQALMILSVPSAIQLAGWLVSGMIGDAARREELGEMERSALAEMGNLAISRFLNCVAVHAGWSRLLRPSAPGVMVNMLGAIMDVVVTPVAASHDELLIVETLFRDARNAVQIRFWVLPERGWGLQ